MEFIIIWIFIKSSLLKSLLASVVINLITVPLVNVLNLELGIEFFYLEIIVFVVEIFLLLFIFRTRFGRAFVVSLLMNAASAAVGYYYLDSIMQFITNIK